MGRQAVVLTLPSVARSLGGTRAQATAYALSQMFRVRVLITPRSYAVPGDDQKLIEIMRSDCRQYCPAKVLSGSFTDLRDPTCDVSLTP
jgi:hypothetical protein